MRNIFLERLIHWHQRDLESRKSMTNEPTMKLTDFDYLIGDHHLQMVKAALPYVNVPEQRLLSVFVKMRELQKTLSLFQEDQVAAMGICSLEEGQKGSPLEMMKAIKPYGNTQEQDFIDIVCNFLQGPRLGGQYPDIVAAQSAPDDMVSDPPPTDIVSHDSQTLANASHYNSRSWNNSSQDKHSSEDGQSSTASASSGSEFNSSETTGSGNEAYGSSTLSATAPAIHPMRSSIEQLKGFLPPDQQARLEQATFLLQTLQQFT